MGQCAKGCTGSVGSVGSVGGEKKKEDEASICTPPPPILRAEKVPTNLPDPPKLLPEPPEERKERNPSLPDVEMKVEFTRLKGKLKKYLRSLPLKPRFKYVRLTEWYKRTENFGGGFGITEHTPGDLADYTEDWGQLAEDLSDPEGFVESFTLCFADYWAGEVVYPVETDDIQFVQCQLEKLIKLR